MPLNVSVGNFYAPGCLLEIPRQNSVTALVCVNSVHFRLYKHQSCINVLCIWLLHHSHPLMLREKSIIGWKDCKSKQISSGKTSLTVRLNYTICCLRWGGSREPNPDCTYTSQLTSFHTFCRKFQPPPVPKNTVYRGRRFVEMRIITLIYCTSVPVPEIELGLSTSSLASGLHRILPPLRTQRSSYACPHRQYYGPYSRTDLTVAVRTRLLMNNPVLRRSHGCLRLALANGTFLLPSNILSVVQSRAQMQLAG